MPRARLHAISFFSIGRSGSRSILWISSDSLGGSSIISFRLPMEA